MLSLALSSQDRSDTVSIYGRIVNIIAMETSLPGVEPEISDWDWGDAQTEGETEEPSPYNLTPLHVASPTYEMETFPQMEASGSREGLPLLEEDGGSDDIVSNEASVYEVRHTKVLYIALIPIADHLFSQAYWWI